MQKQLLCAEATSEVASAQFERPARSLGFSVAAYVRRSNLKSCWEVRHLALHNPILEAYQLPDQDGVSSEMAVYYY